MIYPLLFKPVYKDYIWGGQRILSMYQRDESPGIYAESWELSDRSDGMSVVVNGEFKGKTLHELLNEKGNWLTGQNFDVFPLLIKLIDAKENLSLQVHPDDLSSQKYGGEAKTEMWYILAADAQSSVWACLKKDVEESALKKALTDKKLVDMVQRWDVKKGDVISIPGGRVHAIGAGCMMLEVQQNSNTTYRLYDWDRNGLDGKPRALHIDESLKVIHWDDSANPFGVQEPLDEAHAASLLLQTPYFRLEKHFITEKWDFMWNKQSFQIFFVEEGVVDIQLVGGSETVKKGSTVLIPAAAKRVKIVPKDQATLIRVTLN
ncbi:MAG: class I mannose-6-phosphate isomerase [Parachlamydiales bacterium]|nr:class I mannose-6-phosphate isomerase [Parachlamydiales bacterium]